MGKRMTVTELISLVFDLTGEMIEELNEEMAGSNNPAHWKHYAGGIESVKEFENRFREKLGAGNES